MSNEVTKTSQIRIDVSLDKDNLPLNIHWDAYDADFAVVAPSANKLLEMPRFTSQ